MNHNRHTITHDEVWTHKLLEDLGMSMCEYLAEYAVEGIVPGICRKCGTVEYCCEPDAEHNFCKVCREREVVSGMVLMGII